MSETNRGENSFNSLMPLWLYMILKERASSEKPLSRIEIEKILKDEYFICIGEKDRNKVLRYIKTLSAYFKEKETDNAIVEIKTEKTYENNAKRTVTAWYIDTTKVTSVGDIGIFSVAEINFLTDMVKSSQVISSDCTVALINKLSAFLNKSDSKELLKKSYEKDLHKNENKYLLEIRDRAEEAISESRQLSLTYDVDGNEKYFIITPMRIDYVDGKCFILGYRGKRLERFFIEKIRDAYLYKEDTKYQDSDEKMLIDTEKNIKNTKTILLDTLFSNTNVICDAIKNKKYITFSYLSYIMENGNPKLSKPATNKVIPVKTAYKSGKPYLIAIDHKNNYQPVFFRIELMKDVSSSGYVDFMDTRRFNIKESNEYTDAHPFMLLGFTKIRATFLIKADSLDRVIDVFGDKAVFGEPEKAFETMGENARKLAHRYPELDFSERLGFDHNEEVVSFTVETTDEEAIKFALQNGDCVELRSPEPLRERILNITAKMTARHTRMISEN